MLELSPPQFRRRHRRPNRIPPTPRPALALVSVEVDFFDGSDGEVRLVFNTTADNPIGDVSAAVATKWTARYGGIAYTGMALMPDSYNSLLLGFGGAGADAGPDEINYSNDPSDVSDGAGRQLAAFEGFPL